jgi:hypothetical protein
LWVPNRVERRLFQGLFSSVEEKQVFDLEWKSVNEPIDADVFTYKGFDVPADVAVQDSSSGSAIWIKELPKVELEDAKPRVSGFRYWIPIVVSISALTWFVRRRFVRLR